MVPHCWITEAMKMVIFADNIVNVFENSKETWITELIGCNESLGEVDIGRGIFQGDSFSPLLFVVVLIPLPIILNETDLGYIKKSKSGIESSLVYGRFKAVCKELKKVGFVYQDHGDFF